MDENLIKACKSRNFNKIQRLLPLTTLEGKYNCLVNACKKGDYELFNTIFRECAHSLNVYDLNWLLIKATRGGNIDIFNDLVNAGANRVELLDIAAAEGHLPLVKRLIELGAREYTAALEYAIINKHPDIVKFFIKLGSNFDPDMQDKYNQLMNKHNSENTNTFLTLANTGRIRRSGILGSFRAKKERPALPYDIAKKIMSYLEFGIRRRSRKRTRITRRTRRTRTRTRRTRSRTRRRSRRTRGFTKKQRPQSVKRQDKKRQNTMPYTIELAKSGRSTCKACKENIENQELRFGSGSENGYMFWKHFTCLTEKIKNNVLAVFPNPEDIPGVAELNNKDKSIVLKYFNSSDTSSVSSKKSNESKKSEKSNESKKSEPKEKKQKEKIEIDVLLAQTFKLNSKGEFPDVKGWWMTEKIDGIRAYWSHKDGKLYTRSGFIIDAPEWFIKELPKDMDFDGEIWISRKLTDFNKVSGIGRRTRKTEKDEEDWKSVKYLVFDIPTLDKPYEERLKTYIKIIKKMKNSPHIIALEATNVRDTNHVFEELEKVEKIGGEGLMLRKPGSMYERKRSSTLLKVKSFEEDEAIITGYNKGSGKYSEFVGAIVAKDKSGNIITLGTGLTDEIRKNPPPIGTQITYKFFEKTKDGHPRHPVYKGIRTDVEFKPKKKVKKEE